MGANGMSSEAARRRTAILLNDCSRPFHLGTVLVAQNLQHGLAAVGIDLIRSYPRGYRRWDAEFDRTLEDVDVVIINGEGTCHHDAPDALRCFEGARRASEHHKPVVLLNTVWQDNSVLNGALGWLDRVFVRESASAAEVLRSGGTAAVVPDLSLAAPIEAGPEAKHDLPFVTDSVDYETSLRLGELAVSRRWPFRPLRRWTRGIMVRHPHRALAIALGCRGRLRRLVPGHLPEIGRSLAVITGRFHGICLALLSGRPFIGVTSNTHKNGAIAADIGLEEFVLDERSLTPDRVDELLDRVRDRGCQEEIRRKLAAYLVQARAAQQAMFDEIRSLAALA